MNLRAVGHAILLSAALLLVGCDNEYTRARDAYTLACMKESNRSYRTCFDMFTLEQRLKKQ